MTGISGFVGSVTFDALQTQGHKISGLLRNGLETVKLERTVLSDLTSETDFSNALMGQDVVIHIAALVHVMKKKTFTSLQEYREVNTLGTINLARQAAAAGVKRFIFISTIKVNGDKTKTASFSNFDKRQPTDSYSVSKSLAEISLLDIAKDTGLEVTIIRPPLVYGPNVKANFAALLNLVNKGFPLPFGTVDCNKRSMVYVGNLVDLIINCIDNPNAANQVFMVSDDHDLSTRELVTQLGLAFGKSPLLFPFPVWAFRLLGKIVGKTEQIERLVGSLQVDIQHTKRTLSWCPPYTIKHGMAETVRAFLEAKTND